MSLLDLTAPTVDLVRTVCDIPSVSDDERVLADAIEQAITAVSHLDVYRNGDTIVARTQQNRPRRVIIAGHIDTVPVNNNLPTRALLDDGRDMIWGRGTVDMKSGLAIQLALAAQLREPGVDITWIWYDHEEVEAERSGLTRLVRDRPDLCTADFAILGEPSNANVEGGCNGTLRFTVHTRGTRAHSARAWMGHNAIHDAAAVLDILARYTPEQPEVDGLVYREGLNAVGIHGGIAGNVLPDHCGVQINYRFAPSRSLEQAQERMREMFSGYELEFTDGAPGARPGLDTELVQEFVQAVDAEVTPKYGWTDVARFSGLGIPAVNYGPGDPSLAHHDQERVCVDDIIRVENGLRAWLSRSS